VQKYLGPAELIMNSKTPTVMSSTGSGSCGDRVGISSMMSLVQVSQPGARHLPRALAEQLASATAIAARRGALLSNTARPEQDAQRLQDDQEVKQDALILDVVEIVAELRTGGMSRLLLKLVRRASPGCELTQRVRLAQGRVDGAWPDAQRARLGAPATACGPSIAGSPWSPPASRPRSSAAPSTHRASV
jgi:hypothetical protein